MKISMKGLAKFMTSGPAAQRKILYDYKHPDPEGKVQAWYYERTRDAIEEYHRRDEPSSWLEAKARILRLEADRQEAQRAARLRHNARALEAYATHFGDRRFSMANEPRLRLTHAGVIVTAKPDLHVVDGRHHRIIKLHLAEDEPDRDSIQIMSQIMLEAETASGEKFPASSIWCLDVTRGKVLREAKVRSRCSANIRAAIENIAALWPTI